MEYSVLGYKEILQTFNGNLSVNPENWTRPKVNTERSQMNNTYIFIGALYQDGTRNASKADDVVAPGETITMTWAITSDFAPTEDDPSCLPFSYHSHSDPEMGINSGLVGLLLVCKPGKRTHDGRPRDGIKNECHICIQN